MGEKDQDWESLLKEQEKFLAAGRADSAAKVHRKSAPTIGNSEKNKNIKKTNTKESVATGVPKKNTNVSSINNVPQQVTHQVESSEKPIIEKKSSPFLSTKIIDRSTDKAVLKPMLVPMPMNIGKSFPSVSHRSKGGPKLGRNNINVNPSSSSMKMNPVNKPIREETSSIKNPTFDPESRKPGSVSTTREGGGTDKDMNEMLTEISSSNTERVASMSPEEVAMALQELQGMFSDQSLAFLKTRGEKKLGLHHNENDGGNNNNDNIAADLDDPHAYQDDVVINSDKKKEEEEDKNISSDVPSEGQEIIKELVEREKQILLNERNNSTDLSEITDKKSLLIAQSNMPELEKVKVSWTSDISSTTSSTSTPSTSTTSSTTTSVKTNKTEFEMREKADTNGQRFDLEGWPIVIIKKKKERKKNVTKHQNDNQKNNNTKEEEEEDEDDEEDDDIPMNIGLHHHGLNPGHAGYTMDELCLLARSLHPSQRLLATSILSKAIHNIRIILSHLSSCHAQLQQIGKQMNDDDVKNNHSTDHSTDHSTKAMIQMKNFALWMHSLKPLRIPVQLPSLACDLLSDASLAVRGEACVLLCALSNETDCFDNDDFNFEGWRAHLGIGGAPNSPFRKLATGQAALESHAATNLREISWDPLRREEEEKDDKEDGQHKLLSAIEEKIDFILGGDEEDANPKGSVHLGQPGNGRVFEEEEDKVAKKKKKQTMNGMFSSSSALQLTALKYPLKPLISLENDEKYKKISIEQNIRDNQNDKNENDDEKTSLSILEKNMIRLGLIGRCLTAVVTPGLSPNATKAGIDSLCSIARMSKHASEKIASTPALIRILENKFLQPTNQQKKKKKEKINEEEEEDVEVIDDNDISWWWHASSVLKLFRILMMMSRDICLLFAQTGVLTRIKSFLAMSPPSLITTNQEGNQEGKGKQIKKQQSLILESRYRLSLAMLEVLRIWRVSLTYGVDLESLPTILQLAPPKDLFSASNGRNSLASTLANEKDKHEEDEEEEEDDEDDDGPIEEEDKLVRKNQFFNGYVFNSTIAPTLPLSARFVTLFLLNSDSDDLESDNNNNQPLKQHKDHKIDREVKMVDSLCSALFYALEEALNAWHHLSSSTPSGSSSSSVMDKGDEVIAAAIDNLGYDSKTLRKKDILISQTLLDVCGNILLKIGESSRNCLLLSHQKSSCQNTTHLKYDDDYDILLNTTTLLPNDRIIQFSSLRTGAAISSYLATLTSVGRSRAQMRKIELKEKIKKSVSSSSHKAFFIPPPPSSTSTRQNSSEDINIQTQDNQNLIICELLVIASKDLLNSSTSSFLHLQSKGNDLKGGGGEGEGNMTNNVSNDADDGPLARARQITSLILKEAVQMDQSSQIEIEIMNRLICFFRLFNSMNHDSVNDNLKDNTQHNENNLVELSNQSDQSKQQIRRMRNEVQEFITLRIDTFIKKILFSKLESTSSFLSSSSSSSSSMRSLNTPIMYRSGHAGMGSTALRRRGSIRKLLLHASTAMANHDQTSDHHANSTSSSSFQAIEWLAMAVPLFECGQEQDAKHIIDTYLIKQSNHLWNENQNQKDTQNETISLLSSCYQNTLEPFYEDSFHSLQLSNEHELLNHHLQHSSTSTSTSNTEDLTSHQKMLPSPLLRSSLCLLPFGNQFNCSASKIINTCMLNHHLKQLQKQNGPTSYVHYNENNEEIYHHIADSNDTSPSLPPPPLLNITLPLTNYWLLTPLLLDRNEGISDMIKTYSHYHDDEEKFNQLYEIQNEKHNLIKISIAFLHALFIQNKNNHNNHNIYNKDISHIKYITPEIILMLLSKHILYGEFIANPSLQTKHINTKNDKNDKNVQLSNIFPDLSQKDYLLRLFDVFPLVMSACVNKSTSSKGAAISPFCSQLLDAVLIITPPSALDRIEALAATLTTSTNQTNHETNNNNDDSMKGVAKIIDRYQDNVNAPLPNRCLERFVRIMIRQFAQSPPSSYSINGPPSLELAVLLQSLLRCLLSTSIPATTRAVIWSDLAQLQVLHLLGEGWYDMEEEEEEDSLNNLYGGSNAFLYPLDKEPMVLTSYVTAIVSIGNRSIISKPIIDQQLNNNNNNNDDMSTSSSSSMMMTSNNRISFLWIIAVSHLFAVSNKEEGDENGNSISWGQTNRLADMISLVPVHIMIELLKGFLTWYNSRHHRRHIISNVCYNKIKSTLLAVSEVRNDLKATCNNIIDALFENLNS